MRRLASLALVAAAFSLNLHTYHRLTLEQPVAEIRFKRLDPQLFEAELWLADGERRRLELAGDEWQIDARVLKWRGLATLAGLQPVYRLERLSGRYQDPSQEQSGRRTVYRLRETFGLDLWASARRAVAGVGRPRGQQVRSGLVEAPERDERGSEAQVDSGEQRIRARGGFERLDRRAVIARASVRQAGEKEVVRVRRRAGRRRRGEQRREQPDSPRA